MSSETMKQIKQMMAGQNSAAGMGFALSKDTDYTKTRAITEAQNNQMPLEPGVTFMPDVLSGVEVELNTPEKITSDAIVLYIHGGGFAYGSIASCRSITSAIAGEAGCRVYSINYRLAPENPFPAGADDCFAVYKALLEKYPQSRIAVMGESAGGTLTLVVMLMAKDNNVKLPACILSYSACTTIAEELPSHEKNKDTDVVLPANVMELVRGIVEAMYKREQLW